MSLTFWRRRMMAIAAVHLVHVRLTWGIHLFVAIGAMGSTITPSSTISSALMIEDRLGLLARTVRLDFVLVVGPKVVRMLDQTSVSPLNSWKNWARTRDLGSIWAVSAWSSLTSPRTRTCAARPCFGRGGGRGVIKFLPVPFYSRAL